MPAIFAQHGDGSPLAITQSHPHTDDSLISKLIALIYKGRIFLPCGVYSQRMQSVLDVIDLVSSVQYHEPQLLSSASAFVVARRSPSSAVAGADACRISALQCGFLTVDEG